MSVPTIQTAFVVGEVAPSLFGHVDLARMKAAASTARNVYVSYRGGMFSRAGTAFVGFSKQTGRTVPPRLIPFQFNVNQGLALEFGNFYMRVVSNGAFVTETPLAITNITKANPAVVTGTISALSATPNNAAVSASYAPGDTVTLAGGTVTTRAVVSVTNTELVSLALNSPGTGVYAPGDTIVPAGGTQTSPVVLAVSTTKVVSATIAAAGTGGTPGAATVTGTTGTGTKFQAAVTISAGGVITSVNSISLAGSYTVNPTVPTAEPVTGGALVGAQLNVKLGIATFAIFSPGVFSANSATFTQGSTSGAGTGATFQTAVFGPHAVSVATPGVYTVFPANPVAQFSTSGTGSGVTFTVVSGGTGDLANGDWVEIESVAGMTEVNGETYVVTNHSGTSFELYDVYGSPIDSSAFAAYTSGGTAARIYTLETPYAEDDLKYLKFTQSADVMSICDVNQESLTEYEPQDLSRLADDDWVFSPVVPAPSVTPPASVTLATSSAGAVSYQYVVTSLSPQDGSESIASPIGAIASAVNIAATAGTITISWPAVHGINAYYVYKAIPAVSTATIPVGATFGFLGRSFGNQFLDTNIVADFAQVPPKHTNPFARGQVLNIAITGPGTGYTAATTVAIATSTGSGFIGRPIIGSAISGQRIAFASHAFLVGQTVAETNGVVIATGTVVAVTATTIDILNTSQYAFIAGPNVFNTVGDAAQSISVEFITISGTTGIVGVIVDDPGQNYLSTDTVVFTDSGGGTGATADLTVGPTSGTYPSVPTYFQQRRGYANSLNQPDTYNFSKPGAYTNFDRRIPPISSDAFTGNPWSVQVNGIQFMVDMPGGLVCFTGAGLWQLTGTGGSSFSPQPIGPDSQDSQPQARRGCSPTLPPLKIDYNILFGPAKGSGVYEVAYQIGANIYTTTDITINSPHLFTDFTVKEWAWCEEPNKLVWSVRSDGTMLCLTYLRPQEVAGWTRHDTYGSFESVCSVIEPMGSVSQPLIDALYVATQRFPGTHTAYMIERMDNRLWETVEDVWAVDCALSLTQPEPAATLTASSATGLGALTGVTALVGGSGYSAGTTAAVVDDNGQGPGTGAVAVLTIAAGVITNITFSPAGTDYVRPALVFTDPANTGSGASARVTLSNVATFSASAPVFTNPTDIGKVIRMGGGIATITAFGSTTSVTADISSPIIDLIPNSGGRPRPQQAGSWTMTAPVTTISGLKYLAGATVTGLADGVAITPRVVTATGIITLDAPASAVVVGLGFQAQLQSVYLDTGSPTVQGQRKKVAAATARIEASRGLKMGSNQPDGSAQSPPQLAPAWHNLADVPDDGPNFPLKPYNATAVPLRTGDIRIVISGGFQTPGQVCVQQDYPLPMNILAFVSEIDPGDTVQRKWPQKGRGGDE